MVMLWRHNERARAPLRFEQLGSSLLDDPEALRIYAALFEKMLPIEATLAAARALRLQAAEIERRRNAGRKIVAEIMACRGGP